MKDLDVKLSRREAALVAAALLLPIPLFAQSGLSVPLPGAVERSLGSLVTLDADERRSGTRTTGRAAAKNENERGSGGVSLRVSRGGSSTSVFEDGTLSAAENGGSTASDEPAGDSESGGGTPTGGNPGDAGDGSSTGSPGDPESTQASPSDTGAEPATERLRDPGASVAATGPGARVGMSVGSSGLHVDLGADDGDVRSDEPGVQIDVAEEDGSSTGFGVTLPGVGVVTP